MLIKGAVLETPFPESVRTSSPVIIKLPSITENNSPLVNSVERFKVAVLDDNFKSGFGTIVTVPVIFKISIIFYLIIFNIFV